MPEKKDDKKVVAEKQPKFDNTKKKNKGKIVKNPYLDNWLCVDNTGKCVLGTTSLEKAIEAYPDFNVIKE